MARKHVASAYEEPRSKHSIWKEQVRRVDDSTRNQAAKTHRVYQSFLLQRNGNAPKRFLKFTSVGDNAGNLVCHCVDDIRLQRLMAVSHLSNGPNRAVRKFSFLSGLGNGFSQVSYRF